MTSNILRQAEELRGLDHFPEFPPRDDMQNPIHLYVPGYLTTLHRHFELSDTTLVLSEVPLGWRTSQRAGIMIPDLMVAFGVDVPMIIAQWGYAIDTHGRPPDFVLEVASPTTARNDEAGKRVGYRDYQVPEYWRFDPSGGQYYRQGLAGDRLVAGEYQPIELTTEGNRTWGYSAALGLTVCWEAEKLRWWDPNEERYLATHNEEAEARRAAEANHQAADQRFRAAEAGRLAAEARIRELEAELERRRSAEHPQD